MKYFTIEELTQSATARRLGIDNTPPAEALKALEELTETVLDPLREAWQRPIKVNSGYRCPELNRKVGGVSNSRHLLGKAADITAGSREDNKRLYALLRRLRLPVREAINEKGGVWIHVAL